MLTGVQKREATRLIEWAGQTVNRSLDDIEKTIDHYLGERLSIVERAQLWDKVNRIIREQWDSDRSTWEKGENVLRSSILEVLEEAEVQNQRRAQAGMVDDDWARKQIDLLRSSILEVLEEAEVQNQRRAQAGMVDDDCPF